MSKKSAASLSIVPPNVPGGTLAAPAELSEDERNLWNEVVASKPAEWFGDDSAPLLKEYVRAAVLCDVLDAKAKRAIEGGAGDASVGLIKMLLDMRDKEAKRVASFATKLRLTQQSRYTPQSASTANNRASGKRPWQAS